MTKSTELRSERPSIDTLVQDIQDMLGREHKPDPAHVSQLGNQIAETIANRMSEHRKSTTLRMSNIGKPDRKLWYDVHQPTPEALSPSVRMKFLFGDILELVLLFLAREAGHEVGELQGKVEVNGVKGSKDAKIDGVVVDCKSASTHSFKKFKTGTLLEDDPFGYVEQLAGYSEGDPAKPDGAFLAIDKTLGHITLLKLDRATLEAVNVPQLIEHKREVLAAPDPPERCYEPIPEGKSGNMVLDVGCNYCEHKFKCWQDANNKVGLRTFLYYGGPKHFTHIEKEPNVPEVTF